MRLVLTVLFARVVHKAQKWRYHMVARCFSVLLLIRDSSLYLSSFMRGAADRNSATIAKSVSAYKSTLLVYAEQVHVEPTVPREHGRVFAWRWGRGCFVGWTLAKVRQQRCAQRAKAGVQAVVLLMFSLFLSPWSGG